MLVVLTQDRDFLFGTPNECLAECLLKPDAMGVDLVFMISGFIMVLTTKNADCSRLNSLQFLIKCFSRIGPVHAIPATIGVQVYWSFDHYTVPANVIGLLKSLLFLPVDPAEPP